MVFGKTINRYYKKYWYYFLIGIIAIVCVDLAQLFIPEIVGGIVGRLDSNSMTIDILLTNILYMVAIVVTIFLGRIIWRLCINGASMRIQADLRRRLFSHCEELSRDFYSTHKTGATMAYLTNDVETIGTSFADSIIFLIDIVVLGIVAMVKMITINWLLSMVVFAALFFLILSGNIFEKLETKRYEESNKAFEQLSDYTTENLSGISVIKAFIREKESIKGFSVQNMNNRNKAISFLKLDAFYSTIINALIYVGAVAIVLLGGYLAVSQTSIPGVKEFNGKSLTTFFLFFDTLIWPFLACVFLISTISRCKASYRRITSLLETPITVKDREGVVPSDVMVKGNIELRNLSFSYPDAKDSVVLKDITVKIEAGQTVGIIGRTGSGKSTLVNVLLKVFNIPDDKVFIDERDINLWATADLRRSIGYVSQETFLFSSTVKSNISFGDPSLTDERITEAAKFACVDDNITNFPHGYNTIIGERGATLSGGQKQRISMARAIAKDPQILILDDSVSAVDSSTERAILSNIRELRKGKTTLIITHRISAIENLDKIIVMEGGAVVGFGNHEQLLENSAIYRHLVELQKLEKEIQ